MPQFIINGGQPLEGTFTPSGNKNAALPMLAACLLTEEEVRLTKVPDILDVRVMLQLLQHLGVKVTQNKNTVCLKAEKLDTHKLDPELCRQVRSSILLAGPLTARCGKAELYPPGGDVIGRRRLDTHFLGLKAIGYQINLAPSVYRFSCTRPSGTHILLDEASVTATENIMMAACLAKGKTTIFNAACEPHVTDLGRMLNKMGARISGLGTNHLTIRGVSKLHGTRHRIGADYIEIGSIIAAVAATKGRVEIPVAHSEDWLPVLQQSFARLGVDIQSKYNRLTIDARKERRIQKDLTYDIPKVEDGPWPTFPSDLMSNAIVLATQTAGTTLFFEKMFESRMYFVDNLISMGAQIVQCDPHRVVVIGPADLHASHMTSPDIRAGMALIIAALCASGTSIIDNAQIVDRGYEGIDRRLKRLGADIERH
jgi:UDP-N-acetylglucosamine 1-carboxyvinyltransferase